MLTNSSDGVNSTPGSQPKVSRHGRCALSQLVSGWVSLKWSWWQCSFSRGQAARADGSPRPRGHIQGNRVKGSKHSHIWHNGRVISTHGGHNRATHPQPGSHGSGRSFKHNQAVLRILQFRCRWPHRQGAPRPPDMRRYGGRGPHTFTSMDALRSLMVIAPWAQFSGRSRSPRNIRIYKGLPALCISIFPALEPPTHSQVL